MKVYLSSAIVLLLAGVTFLGCDNSFLSGKCSKEDTAYTLGYQTGKKNRLEQQWIMDNPLSIVPASQSACRAIVSLDTQAEALFPICTQAWFEGFANKNPTINLCPKDKCDPLIDRLAGTK